MPTHRPPQPGIVPAGDQVERDVGGPDDAVGDGEGEGPVVEGLRHAQAHDQQPGHRPEDHQPDGALLRVDHARQPRVADPGPPQHGQHEQPTAQAVPVGVGDHQRRALGEAEDEDEVEEELEWLDRFLDPWLSVDPRPVLRRLAATGRHRSLLAHDAGRADGFGQGRLSCARPLHLVAARDARQQAPCDGVRGGARAVEPAPDAGGAELDLVGGELAADGPSRSPLGRLAAQERDVDLGDLVVAELEVADARARRRWRRLGRRAARAMIASATTAAWPSANTPAFGRADAGDVADRVHVGERTSRASAGRPGSSRRRSGPTPRRPRAPGAPGTPRNRS